MATNHHRGIKRSKGGCNVRSHGEGTWALWTLMLQAKLGEQQDAIQKATLKATAATDL